MEWLIYIFIIRFTTHTNTAVLKGQSAPGYGYDDRSQPLFPHIHTHPKLECRAELRVSLGPGPTLLSKGITETLNV